MKNFRTFLFITAWVVGIGSSVGAQTTPDRSKEPVLVPLTDEEKKIDPKEVVAKQPDFTATQTYFSAREISGFSAASKVARKGNKYRTDTGFVVVIAEPKKPTLRLNQDKTYEEGVGIPKPFVSATVALNPTDLLEFEDISFSSLGTVQIDGNTLLKIQARSKEFPHEVFLYADFSKRNLITIVQILSPQRSSVQRLQEISFDVPKEFFDISSYKALPKFKWTRVATAKVIYRGKVVHDGAVFRHADYLFVHAGEFDHLFIDLRSNTAATVVYRGLLLSKEGRLIWQTNDAEATSVGELERVIEKGGQYTVPVQSTANSVTVPERDKKGEILLKVEW